MTPVVSLIVALLLLALAVWSVVVRDAFLAVAGFVAYGLLLSLVWVRLFGLDVALTEAAIGGGLTGALLLGAVARLRGTEAAAHSYPLAAAKSTQRPVASHRITAQGVAATGFPPNNGSPTMNVGNAATAGQPVLRVKTPPGGQMLPGGRSYCAAGTTPDREL